MGEKIKVLVVDDQAIIRSILERALNASDDIEVVGKAADAYEARDKIIELRPDVMTLDVEMPKMNGVQFLRKLMPQYPMPVVMVSSHTKEGQQITLEALESGAVDFVPKPDGSEGSMEVTFEELREKVRIASKTNLGKWKRAQKISAERKVIRKPERHKKIKDYVVIGASTGGTTALRDIITSLPADFPATVVVQHMPEGFTKLFADRLEQISEVKVKEAVHGDQLKSGHVLVAPGDFQLELEKKGADIFVVLSKKDKMSGHRPSVDMLFRSAADILPPKKTIGVILTGMGKDGAQGMKIMHDKGIFTIGQDKDSCIVYGMPAEAYSIGAVDIQLPLEKIAEGLVSRVHGD